MVPSQKTQANFSQKEIEKRSKKVIKVVQSYKAKLRQLKKKQDGIVQNYVKRLEKMKIEEVKKRLG